MYRFIFSLEQISGGSKFSYIVYDRNQVMLDHCKNVLVDMFHDLRYVLEITFVNADFLHVPNSDFSEFSLVITWIKRKNNCLFALKYLLLILYYHKNSKLFRLEMLLFPRNFFRSVHLLDKSLGISANLFCEIKEDSCKEDKNEIETHIGYYDIFELASVKEVYPSGRHLDSQTKIESFKIWETIFNFCADRLLHVSGSTSKFNIIEETEYYSCFVETPSRLLCANFFISFMHRCGYILPAKKLSMLTGDDNYIPTASFIVPLRYKLKASIIFEFKIIEYKYTVGIAGTAAGVTVEEDGGDIARGVPLILIKLNAENNYVSHLTAALTDAGADAEAAGASGKGKCR